MSSYHISDWEIISIQCETRATITDILHETSDADAISAGIPSNEKAAEMLETIHVFSNKSYSYVDKYSAHALLFALSVARTHAQCLVFYIMIPKRSKRTGTHTVLRVFDERNTFRAFISIF